MWKKCSFSLFVVSHCTQRCHSRRCKTMLSCQVTHTPHKKYQPINFEFILSWNARCFFVLFYIKTKRTLLKCPLHTLIHQYMPTKIITLTHTPSNIVFNVRTGYFMKLFCESASLIFPCNVEFFLFFLIFETHNFIQIMCMGLQ